MDVLRHHFGVSQRRACKTIRASRSTCRYAPIERDDESLLTRRIIELAAAFGRYGYRRITALLKHEGWRVNHKRVERVWKQQGLKVPQKLPKRGRLWLDDGSCVRLRPERRDHVWAYDFVQARTHDGRAFRMLTVVDEYTRESLAIDISRKLRSDYVLGRLAWVFVTRGVPDHIRSDNGPEFTAKVVRKWLRNVGVKTLFIEPGSPWENGYCESFNGKLRDELLNGEIFYTLREAKVLIERWRRHYNTVRPHSSLSYRPPAPEAIGKGDGICNFFCFAWSNSPQGDRAQSFSSSPLLNCLAHPMSQSSAYTRCGFKSHGNYSVPLGPILRSRDTPAQLAACTNPRRQSWLNDRAIAACH